MHIAAYRVKSTFEYVQNVKTEYPTNKYSPELFLVRGTSAAAWKSLWAGEVAVMVCTVILQVSASIAISVVLYRPVAALVSHLQAKGWKTAKNPATVVNSAHESQKDASTDAKTGMFVNSESPKVEPM
jgi:hypothetical protein